MAERPRLQERLFHVKRLANALPPMCACGRDTVRLVDGKPRSECNGCHAADMRKRRFTGRKLAQSSAQLHLSGKGE